jgi:endonuclease IV
MNYAQIMEDNRANPVPMIMETNVKEYYDETGKLTRNYSLEKNGSAQSGPVE